MANRSAAQLAMFITKTQLLDAEAEDALWNKHRADATKIILEIALKALADKGPDVMLKFLDEHIEIFPTDAEYC